MKATARPTDLVDYYVIADKDAIWASGTTEAGARADLVRDTGHGGSVFGGCATYQATARMRDAIEESGPPERWRITHNSNVIDLMEDET